MPVRDFVESDNNVHSARVGYSGSHEGTTVCNLLRRSPNFFPRDMERKQANFVTIHSILRTILQRK